MPVVLAVREGEGVAEAQPVAVMHAVSVGVALPPDAESDAAGELVPPAPGPPVLLREVEGVWETLRVPVAQEVAVGPPTQPDMESVGVEDMESVTESEVVAVAPREAEAAPEAVTHAVPDSEPEEDVEYVPHALLGVSLTQLQAVGVAERVEVAVSVPVEAPLADRLREGEGVKLRLPVVLREGVRDAEGEERGVPVAAAAGGVAVAARPKLADTVKEPLGVTVEEKVTEMEGVVLCVGQEEVLCVALPAPAVLVAAPRGEPVGAPPVPLAVDVAHTLAEGVRVELREVLPEGVAVTVPEAVSEKVAVAAALEVELPGVDVADTVAVVQLEEEGVAVAPPEPLACALPVAPPPGLAVPVLLRV